MLLAEVSRKQAFLTHLAVSASVFAVISYLIIFHWFPDFYFHFDGGSRAILTIFFVDVVLGPGLTLIIFKQGKKGLKFDVAVILLMQLSALVWGVKTVYTERPGATVFYTGKFTCLTQADTSNMNMAVIKNGPSGRQNLSLLQRPDTIDDFIDFTKEAFSHGSSAVYHHAEKIVPLDGAVINRLQNYRLDVTKLAMENEVFAEKVASYMDSYKADKENIDLIPLSCRYGSGIAVYDMKQMKIIDWLDIKTSLRAAALDEPLPLKIEGPDYSM